MADGPRCQRRKHTQNSVRSLRSVPEATSDSDDEDKLHIVEEDSINDDSDQKPTVLQLKASRQDTVGQDDGSLGPDALIQEIRVKEECVTDEEDEGADIKVTSDEQQQSEMKAIYPDTPDEHKSTPERGVHDENGTPEAFSHLYTCPHCSRGYKRQTSLKEHIKLRHEKSDDNYCCSLCSYTFTYRTQLVRHMTAHKHIREQRNNSQSGGNRKFKCTECSKAFKYKHHLKEHLRIHSGEKPYECSNCQKRFSHSGSYSSHISSKKCASVTSTVNGLPRSPEAKTTLTLSRPTPILLKEKVEVTSKPLQEQLPLKQIKQEPVEHQTKPVLASTALTTTTNGVVQATAPQGVVQTLVLPTVGLVQPISINLSDLQNALNAAMDGNVTRPVLVSTSMNGTNAKIIGQAQSQAVVLQPQTQPQVISAFSVPVVGQDGNAKIFINYNPQLGPQLKNAMNAKTSQPVVEQSTVTKPSVEQTSTAQVKSTVTEVTQPPVVQGNSTQSNQTQTSLNPKPTQVSIVRPIQAANPNKPPSIIKITPAQAARLVQARAAQPKFTQQTLLLVRRADGTQSLVVRQVAVANPNTQSTPTADTKAGDINSTPAIMAMSPEKKQTTENSSLEEVSKLTENIKIKTEPDSPSKSDSNMEADGEKDTHTNGNKEEGKHTTHEDKLTFSHSGTVHSGVACGDNFHNYATCLVCDKSPGKRNGMDGLSGDAKESPTTISLTSLLDKDKSGAAERLLPLLKAYSQNPQPTEDQLSQVAKTVRLPIEAVSKWYQRMRSKKILLQGENNLKNKQQEKTSINSTPNTQCYTPPKSPDDTSTDAQNRLQSTTPSPVPSPISVSTDDLKVIVKTEDVEEELQSEPLDLSLPKSTPTEANVTAKLPISAQKEPLNLTCLKKQELTGNTIYVAQAGTGPINIMGTSLPTLVAIAEPGGIPCIGATVSANKRTIFIPQLTYTYNSNVNTTNSTAVNTKGMVVINSCLKATEATVTESVSGKEDQNDDDSPVQKKRKKISGGLYACNLCDKMFQKSSSLLRHKYEHTGKRPYECGICQKAFKHKHHLIEHTRLHSGEKPYMCDKCGKRFSHSGSYSQHMNHRYSYCKRESNEHTEPHSTPTPSSHLDSDDRESDGEEEEDFSGLDMSDIRVVRVGEDYDDEEESGGEEQQENTQEEDRHAVVEVELGDIDTLEEEVWETMETEDTEESREESGYGEGDLNHEESAEMATEEQESE